MKWIGIILIILAGGAAGFFQSRKLSERVRLLEQTKSLIKSLENSIRYQAVPLNELISRISNQSCPYYLKYCSAQLKQGRPFPAAWEKALTSPDCKCYLKQDDISLLQLFGKGLGISDIEGQVSHCELYFSMLEEKYQNAKEEQEKKGRLYFMLGILSGLGVALIIL